MTTYQIHPIGFVRRDERGTWLEILEVFRPALLHLGQFSHLQVLWWFHHTDEWREVLQVEPPYNAPPTGVFATRGPLRPNPIGLTTAPIEEVDLERGRIRLGNIDALDDTPVVDLKPYYPVCDRVREVRTPQWAADWPQWMPDEGHAPEPPPEA